MSTLIIPMPLPLPLGMGTVNSYLIAAREGFVLVDTGAPNARERLRADLERLGCAPGRLTLILITHGDFDHTGNAAYLRRVFGSPIGMHGDDAGMAETGDMFASRGRSNAVLRALVPRLIGFGRADRFSPDVLLEDGAPLGEYGLDARVIGLPGHSRGSIGILTAEGALFCGDLLENTDRPRPGSIADDQTAALASLEGLRGLEITQVYPGHGEPFTLDELGREGGALTACVRPDEGGREGSG